ncbi:NAD(P)-dependent oxidoreductase [Trueperella bialowiezensis]|uniref:D-3-phosphoglycerate dehydrogenase n=1 Tax=Trueperella bialowiezensis TaxID=312285 RepID=A0A3S5EVY7_9ACTO|nr:NAD(P)-dependent oxidoreductase [Trueperella bialowiezensis]VEI12634.1 D-3-phosphoglycerate dehydrogenase [Trueperella bialowiezensis]
MTITVSVPNPDFRAAVENYDGEVQIIDWDLKSPAPVEFIDLVLLPLVTDNPDLTTLHSVDARLVQASSIGFEHVLPHIGSKPLANATTVHETSTSELTLALVLAQMRDVPRMVASQGRGEWDTFTAPGLADKKVLVIGWGGIGKAIGDRLRPFEVELYRSASYRREDADGIVYGPEDLPELLPQMDIVILIVPGQESTAKMVDDKFLSLMKDGALIVNMARGSVADTDALVAHADRLKVAFDVVDPEPLPAGHPLYSHPNVLFSAHMGGYSDAMWPRLRALIHRQIDALSAGREPENVVFNQSGN